MKLWQMVAGAVLAVALAAGSFFAGYAAADGRADGRRAVVETSSSGLDLIDQVFRTIRKNSVSPPGQDQLARGAIKGMVGVLRKHDDPYAFFFSPAAFRSFQELTTGRFSGIGVWLKRRSGGLTVTSVLPSSPAKSAGLQRGDLITSIDGRAVTPLTTDQAVARIKGPEGTEVTLGIVRRGESMTLTLRRKSIVLPAVSYRVTGDGRFGYVRLLEFSRGASEQVRRAIEDLRRDGAQGIVLDLRDNGGGLFTEGIKVASLFIEDGPVVRYRDSAAKPVVYRAQGDAFRRMPLVVLVNGGTASASEIVAGALQDRNRAIIVGTRTYGKGSVQQVMALPDASALKLTTASYLTPRGRDINRRGIVPDVEITGPAAEQRQRAVEVLDGVVVSAWGAQG